MGVRAGLAAAGALLVAACAGAAVAAPAASTPSGEGRDVAVADPAARFVPGELLVRFRSGVPASTRAEVLESHGGRLVRGLSVPGLVLARLTSGRGVSAAVEALSRRADVLYAEPNWIYRATATPNDPRFTNGELWGLHQTNDVDIDAPEAWDVTPGSRDVVVAVVDTGVAYDHPDLAPNMWENPGEVANGLDDDGNGLVDDLRGWDFVDDDNDPRDVDGHGTHVAGTIGAKGNDATGVVGVNWDVTLMPVRVLGPLGGTNAQVTDGFAYAAAQGARVVNASLGGEFSQALKDVVDAASDTLFVVAAGNGGWDGLGDDNDASPSAGVYPCNLTSPNLVCVAATTRTEALAGFSNYGTTSVDLGAPGVDIVSTWLGHDSLLTEDFETESGWVGGGSPDTWTRTTEAAALGSWSATDSPGTSYEPFTDNWFLAPRPLDLSGRSGCVVRYALKLDVRPGEGADYFVVKASTNGADWEYAGSWTGRSDEWAWFEEDLSLWEGSPNVLLRFGIESYEPGGSYDGAHVDDVDVRCTSTNYPPTAYRSLDGTSMATPHVAGVAALAWAKNADATVPQVKTALLDGGDAVASLGGRTVTGRRLNAAGALDLIPPGTAPPPSRAFPDFDGDGAADAALFRPSNGGWYVRGQGVIGFGVSTDVPVPGDYDGDGTTDIAVFRPSTGGWHVRGQGVVGFGVSTDVPVPGDYDGDGTTDIAVFRPSTGGWHVRGQGVVGFGTSTDVPVPGDYDGDGGTERAVYRPSNGGWYVQGQGVEGWGTSTDVPVPGDYDGDGDTERAVYRPSNGGWYVQGQGVVGWGTSTDIPVPADYDGDGDVDRAVYRPSTGGWHIQGQGVLGWGTSADKVLALPYAVRNAYYP